MKKALLRGLLALVILWALAFGAMAYLLNDIDPAQLTVSVEEYRKTVIDSVAGFGGLMTGLVIFLTVINIVRARRAAR